MKFSPTSIIAYFLQLFTLPKVKKEIKKYANMFLGEASRFSTGMKGEAIESKESFLILAKYLKNEKLTSAEKKRFKKQTLNILKSAGVVVPVMLIPLPFISTLLLIIMDHVLISMNIQILPTAFYNTEKKDVLTIEGIKKDLKRIIFRKK
jgi:LETM1-like protein